MHETFEILRLGLLDHGMNIIIDSPYRRPNIAVVTGPDAPQKRTAIKLIEPCVVSHPASGKTFNLHHPHSLDDLIKHLLWVFA